MTSNAGIKDIVQREAARVQKEAIERLARTVADAQGELQRRLDSVSAASKLFEAPPSVIDVLARGGAVRVAEMRKDYDDTTDVHIGIATNWYFVAGNLDSVRLDKKGHYRIVLIVERLPPGLKETTGETR